MQQVDLTKTLKELEGKYWGEPNFASSLVIQVHRLRKRPLCELNNEDLTFDWATNESRFSFTSSLRAINTEPIRIRRFIYRRFILFDTQSGERILERT
ncbi:hypothetical protein ACYCS5_03505 [Paenibacillus sp. SEL3]